MLTELKMPVAPIVVADSTYNEGTRLTSMILPLPTFLLAQLRTHRSLEWGHDEDFSVNANSDRAIPIARRIEMVREFPFIPIPSLANPGMTGIEDMPMDKAEMLQALYEGYSIQACKNAETAMKMGASKQFTNRILMPYSWSYVIITGIDLAWMAFFMLRTASDVEPNFRFIAQEMQRMYHKSVPKVLMPGQWHIAFQDDDAETDTKARLLTSASMCARISFNSEKNESLDKHTARAAQCYNGKHFSVFEHQAQVPEISELMDKSQSGNLPGWKQWRKMLERGAGNPEGMDNLKNMIDSYTQSKAV